MTPEQLANFCEAQLADRLQGFNDSEIVRFTPSIKMGQRYIGFKMGGKDYLITLNVKEAE